MVYIEISFFQIQHIHTLVLQNPRFSTTSSFLAESDRTLPRLKENTAISTKLNVQSRPSYMCEIMQHHCPVSAIDSIQKFTSFALILLDSGDYFTRVLSWLRLSIRKASTITLMTIDLAIMCVNPWYSAQI